MSLINDALKRAKLTQAENPPTTPTLEFRAAEAAAETSRQKALLVVGLCLMLIAIIGMATLLVKYATEANRRNVSVGARRGDAPIVAKVQTNAANETVIVAAVKAAEDVLLERKLDPDKPDTNGVPVFTENAAPPLPAFKLQGIFFNPGNPSAVVNGRTIYLGDRVNGFRLIAVSPVAVTLSNGAETNVLSLSQ